MHCENGQVGKITQLPIMQIFRLADARHQNDKHSTPVLGKNARICG
jgi:hypothetical protein